jgi:hypothetical protein
VAQSNLTAVIDDNRNGMAAWEAMAAWKGHANLVLDKTKYVGTGRTGSNRAQIRQEMVERGDKGEYDGIFMAHETDAPLRDAFPSGWGIYWGDALD